MRQKKHLSWGQMLAAVVGAGISLATLMSQVDVFSGLDRIWWLAVAGIILAFGMAAYDKWRDEKK